MTSRPPLKAVTKRGPIDVALRIKNYLQSIMREAKRLQLSTATPGQTPQRDAVVA